MSDRISKTFAGRILSILIFLSFFYPLHSQTNSDGSTPQFLFKAFSGGIVKMKNGSRSGALLNYNTVTEKFVFSKNGELYDMTNTELIDTVYLDNRKFAPVGKIFHEVLVEAPISLYIQHRSSLMSPGAPAGYGGTSQVSNTKSYSSIEMETGRYNLNLPSDFTVRPDPVYWIRQGKEYESFVNEKQFLKIFPGREEEMKKFIKQNKIKFDKMAGMIMLINYCNSPTQ
jgi:hypothetical protein